MIQLGGFERMEKLLILGRIGDIDEQADALKEELARLSPEEIVSFDRHKDFAPGKNYRLMPISPANRLGAARAMSRHLRGGMKYWARIVPESAGASGLLHRNGRAMRNGVEGNGAGNGVKRKGATR